SIYPLRSSIEAILQKQREKIRASAGQEALNVLKEQMMQNWGLILFGTNVSGRKLDAIKRMISSEPVSPKDKSMRIPVPYAIKWYKHEEIVQKCAELGDRLGGIEKMSRGNPKYKRREQNPRKKMKRKT